MKAAKDAEIAQIKDMLKSDEKILRTLKEEDTEIGGQIKTQDRLISNLDTKYLEEQRKLATNTQYGLAGFLLLFFFCPSSLT